MNGNFLKMLRKEKGLTQEQLALMLGYTDRSTISRIEKDEIHLTQDKIKQYADIFNVSVLSILGVNNMDCIDNDSKTIIEIYKNLPHSMRARLLAYAQALRGVADATDEIKEKDRK